MTDDEPASGDEVVVEFVPQWPDFHRAHRLLWPLGPQLRTGALVALLGLALAGYAAARGSSYAWGVIAGVALAILMEQVYRLWNAWQLPAAAWHAQRVGERFLEMTFSATGLQARDGDAVRRVPWSQVRTRDDAVLVALLLAGVDFFWVPVRVLSEGDLARVRAWQAAAAEAPSVPPTELPAAEQTVPGPRRPPKAWSWVALGAIFAAALVVFSGSLPGWLGRSAGSTSTGSGRACALLTADEIRTVARRSVIGSAATPVDPQSASASACNWSLDGSGLIGITLDEQGALTSAQMLEAMDPKSPLPQGLDGAVGELGGLPSVTFRVGTASVWLTAIGVPELDDDSLVALAKAARARLSA